jgi:RNA polymerase sigma-70 factor (ECF subfamily)
MTRGTRARDRTGSGAEVDDRLVEAIARGDVEALGALYDRHAPAMLGLALRILGDAGDAEDLVHDVLIEAWERRQGYDARRGTLRAWLLVRVRSRALDRLRILRLARETGRTYAASPERALAPSSDAQRLLEWKQARVVLDGLSALQREVLDLAYFQGLSASEIAARLDIPSGTAKSRLAGALEALRRRLGAAKEGHA